LGDQWHGTGAASTGAFSTHGVSVRSGGVVTTKDGDITITGTGFVSGTKIMLAGTALTTTFGSPTQVTASGTATAAQTGTLKLTASNPDPGSATSTAFMVDVGNAAHLVKVVPNQVQLHLGEKIAFATAVSVGSGNTSVTWTVNGVAGGNATLGTISGSGIYTAPAVLPNPPQVTVKATSVADPATSGTSDVSVLSSVPVIQSILPLSLPVGNFTLSVSGSNFISGAQVVFGGTFLATTFVSATELTATGTSTQAGTVQVEVINPGPGSPTSQPFAVLVGNSPNQVSASAAARLLEQSTWGPTPQSITHVQQVGMQAFLDEQFAIAASTYADPGPNDDVGTVQRRFFVNAMTGQDQLRQRVAFALSQIMVVSAVKIDDPVAMTNWQRMMLNDAFGNYSTLLQDVTLSPVMGHYLDMVNNDKPDPTNGTSPNENYAREVMQLFSIGLMELNSDGTQQLDSNGSVIPTYTQDTIEGFAHVFTGWTYPTRPGSTPKFWSSEYYVGPMIPFDSHHDTGSKLLLDGVTIPAGGTAIADLNLALADIFNHPDVGPFSSRQLIQKLVTSNPSSDYVSRISAVFADNGSGVRGDLKAVVTALLMDPEARRGDDPAQVQATDGHLKEPLVFMMNLLRAANATTDGDSLSDYASDMKQEPFFPPTVFNFYPPDFVLPGTTLLGPEFKIYNTSTTISRINFVNRVVYWGVSNTTTTNLSEYSALAADPNQLVDTLSSVMLHGQMSDSMRTTILGTVSAISSNSRRAKAAFYLIGSSSQFQVER